ncbi:hypothetical protein IVA78_23355 [Bradyrhizobium sp. 137]|uniref:hypothetical protein n=1 Tax=Bradyrhizobium sp. 137 TaxID=2782614 RepID=UPI001FFC002E|nr:hypothetical protein [Bradyrhizobium sp. 137]MCK1758060.1 hypothetical protein [Bradyrhizobium sp. 137]
MGMDRMRQEHMGRMMEDMDHRTTGGGWRMQRDEDDMDVTRVIKMRIGRAVASRSASNTTTGTNFAATRTEGLPLIQTLFTGRPARRAYSAVVV